MPDNALQSQLWVSRCIGELLAASPTLAITPSNQALPQAITEYISEVFNGNAKSLARQIGVHHRTVYDLRDGRQLPQIGTLLKVCAALGTTPLAIYTGQYSKPTSQADPRTLDVPIARPLKGYQHFNKTSTRIRLREIDYANENPPPSMATVSKRLQLDQSFLQKHFPDESKVISQNYQQYVLTEKLKLDLENREIVRQAVHALHNQGLYPSHKRLTKMLGGALRNPSAREARRQALVELEYERKEALKRGASLS
jgi:DNA-binding XRE family transcriptional regulator